MYNVRFGVSQYIEHQNGISCETKIYIENPESTGSKCPLSLFLNSSSSYSASDIDYVTNISLGNNNGSFTGIAIMNDGVAVGIQGRFSCFDFNKKIPVECNDCVPQAQQPLSCNDSYEKYIVNIRATIKVNGVFEDWNVFKNEFPTETEFCDQNLAYLFDAYLLYLDQIGVTEFNNFLYLTINEFGATPIGYNYDNLALAISDYKDYLNSLPSNDISLSWNEFVDHEYFEKKGFCPDNMPTVGLPDTTIVFPCNQWEAYTDTVNAQTQYDIYIDQLTQAFTQAYIEGAMASLVETFDNEHFDKEYHYTLYYYDRAGNLVQTVPPKGVVRFDGANTTLNNSINQKRATQPEAHDIALAPAHTYQTVYKYNSLNQLVYQITPDGGESRFAYDALGRLVVSQNAKQKLENQFSYTRYDELGRVYEVGELTAPSSDYSIDDIGKLVDGNGVEFDVNHLNFPDNWSMNRKEVTHSIYDELKYIDGNSLNDILINGSQAQSNFEDYHFDNTRNRIMCVMYQEIYDTDLNNYDNASFYNYDVHGNVEELIQVVNDPELIALNQSIKKLSYSYDLVSGNVNEVIYQKGETDEFRHKYNYDADNRITNVFTSKDGVIYEQDAKYFYYDHGPLARTEIGHSKVQAMDYAYTIQGWIKSVNGEEIDEKTMMGWDGAQAANSQVASTINKHVAKDAFGYSLSYYDGDYNSSNTAFLNHSKATTPSAPNLNASLYNGNIRSMFTALSDENENALATHQTNYTYDQLNRIKSMKGYNRVVGQVASESGYSSSYSFDANGNLETLKRNAWDGNASILMDDFEYHYNETINNGHNNRLSGITDHAGASLFQDADIDHSITMNNYKYYQIEQLIEDVDEGITAIKWKVNNKVKEVQYGTNKTISFDYDPMGNRIAKHITEGNNITSLYYVLDAQGNQMSIYKIDNELSNDIVQTERNIYGSSRLGQEQVERVMDYQDIQNLGSVDFSTISIINTNQSICSTGGVLNITETNNPPYIFDYSITDYDNDGNMDLLISNNSTPSTNPDALNTSGYTKWFSAHLMVNTVIGEDYTVQFDVLNVSSEITGFGSINCPLNTTNGSLAISSPGSYSLTFTATSDVSRLKWYNGSPTSGYAQIVLSNISINGPGDILGNGIPPVSQEYYVVENQKGDKRYELANHLGNVLEVITDRKLPEPNVAQDEVLYYLADVVSYSDYYPYGMQMPGKKQLRDLDGNGNPVYVPANGSDGYRYGFNGMEKDDNIKGAGNSYDFGARLYDPRVGRWLSIDPLEKEQPGFTPYKAFYNNPNLFIDPDGRIEWSIHKIINKKTGETKFVIHNVKSNKLRTNGVHTGPGWTKGTLNPFHSRREYYDIAHITTITIDKNGNRSYLYDTETLSKNEPRDEGLWEREKGYTISGESYDDAIANYYEGKEISSLKDLALVGDIIYLGDKIKEKSAQLYRGGIIANNDPTPGNRSEE